MSINHCSEPFWFTKPHYIMDPSTKSSPPHSQNEENALVTIPKEHLFEKPLTPSDVGKLNRLVIPKQHAEKYFPLNNNISSNNDSTGEKGFLLSFEDELGKLWRFRYSYWNSSQSYVLTKGWSRFVKEKKLDAGDVVLFERHRVDVDRQFIGWRRRNSASSAASTAVDGGAAVAQPPGGGGGGWYAVNPYQSTVAVPYKPECLHAGGGVVMQNQRGGGNVNNTRRQVRLFGVNLAESCEADESSSWSEPSTPDGSLSSSHTQQQHQTHDHRYQYGQGQAAAQYYQYQIHYSIPDHAPPAPASYNHNNSTNNHHTNNLDVNYSRDVNQMRYHQG